MSQPEGEQASPPSESRMIFIDDTDPNIQYNGFDWHAQTYTTSNATAFSSLPLYGTLHFTQPLGSNTDITYSYQGTSFIAKFSSTTLSQVTCTIDGQAQKISSLDTLGGGQCANAGTIQEGNHTLVIGLDGSDSSAGELSLFFDGLSYAPSEGTGTGTAQSGDVFITSDPSLSLGPSVTTEWHWDFQFVVLVTTRLLSSSFDIQYPMLMLPTWHIESSPGYSMSLNINYNSELSVIRTNGSYTLDGQGPFNFTTADPLFASTAPQLLVQTPHLELGQHKFHLDYWHDGETIPFSFYGITVQNTTSTVSSNLEVVPPLPSSSTSSTSPLSSPAPSVPSTTDPPNQHGPPNRIPALVGSIIGVVILTTILFTTWIVLRRRRIRARRFSLDLSEDDVGSVDPFHRRSLFSSNRPPKRVEARAERTPLGENDPSLTASESSVTVPVSSSPPPHIRVVVHEDSGREVEQPDSMTEIIELPPNYTSLGRNGRGPNRRELPPVPTSGNGVEALQSLYSREKEILEIRRSVASQR
ncbi:LOW QUALITY PROTEIN: hypothetical protein CVT26_010624 [Gymnopilus dilepis]|uniref:Uncharacterized protein n=1 Tax=Gymnopilus dilepis TaxID=231916 RepID=A0A409W541_9AGAR|nr:LOW QUALITY PROTEIN: hypothetical protein CVT26_010624 [Gymnopilus dilepis]